MKLKSLKCLSLILAVTMLFSTAITCTYANEDNVLSWTANSTTPAWLTLTGYSQQSNSSSYIAFQTTDSSIASIGKNYLGASGSNIAITVSGASTIKVYIAANNNSANKGIAQATMTDETFGSYSLPGRKDATATPYTFSCTGSGTINISNSYNALLYKIEVVSSGPITPAEKYNVEFNVANPLATTTTLTIGDSTIDVAANTTTNKTLSLEAGTYTITSSNAGMLPNPASVTVTGTESAPFDITMEEQTADIIAIDSNGSIVGTYSTISSALSDTNVTAGSTISVKPGYYNECFKIEKTVSIVRSGDEGEVIIYGNSSGFTNMNAVVYVAAPNVKLENLTVINNYNVSYKDVTAKSTSCNQAAALEAYKGCNGSTFNNCKFMSVQDTVVTTHNVGGRSPYSVSFNNCEFYGSTDYVCGAGTVDFNNCDFIVYTGDALKRTTAYIFAPSAYAAWSVNGGSFKMDKDSTITKLYYARAWESASSDTQTLDIYNIDNQVEQYIHSDGIMGFCGTTGGGRSHSITAYHFNMYEGSDNKSNLLATSYISDINIFEMDSINPVISVSGDNTAKMFIGKFGENVSDKFIQNVLADITEIGFVSVDNASADAITDTNTIKTTVLYKKLSSTDSNIPTISYSDAYVGAGVLNGISGEQEVTVVPYVKYDPTYENDSNGTDTEPIYVFGDPVTLTISNN